MKGVGSVMKNSLALGLSLTLVIGLLFLTSCAKKESPAVLEAQAELQTKADDLQREVNAKNDQIKQLQMEKADLQRTIPVFWTVEKGDKHSKIAQDFLIEKFGMSEDEAKKILRDSYLFDQLVIGFQVGNYSDGEKYGGFIVQGDATVSPGRWKRIMAIKKEAEKVVLRNERTLAEVAALKYKAKSKDKAREMNREYETLQAKAALLEKKAESYFDQAKEFESWLNSVYYIAGTKDGLKARGKTDIGSLRFTDMKDRVDLRETTIVELNAGDFRVPAIKKVELVPKTLSVPRDYTVTISADGQSARVNLLNTNAFQLARIIIVIN